MVSFGRRIGIAANGQRVSNVRHSINPIREKRQTDVFFLVLFTVMLCGMFFIAIISLEKGDPGRLIHGVDSWGNVCGRKENADYPGAGLSGMDHSQHPFSYHSDFINPETIINPFSFFYGHQEDAVICVKQCPKRDRMRCEDLLKENGYHVLGDEIAKRVCAANHQNIVPHEEFLNRCVPSTFFENDEGIFSFGNIEHIINSVSSYKSDIYCLIALFSATSIILFILTQLVISMGLFIFLSLSGFSFAAVTTYIWYVWDEQRKKYQNLMSKKETNSEDNMKLSQVAARDASYLLFFSICLSVILAVAVICVAFVIPSSKKVFYLYKEACLFVNFAPTILIQSIATFGCVLAVIIYMVYIGLYILTAQERNVEKDGTVYFGEFFNYRSFWLLVSHFLGCLWVIEFIFGCQRVTIAGAFGRWFFIQDSRGGRNRSMKWNFLERYFPTVPQGAYLLLYNIGSIALASLLVPLLDLGRQVLLYSHRKTMKKKGSCSRCLAESLCCCFCWTENFLQYVGRDNYVYLAIHGIGFWDSGKNSVGLLKRVSHMFYVKMATDLSIWISRIAMGFITGCTGIIWFKLKHDMVLSSVTVLPIFISCIIFYIIFGCLVKIYAIIIDSIFVCYCEDKKLNNGLTRPYFSRLELQEFMKYSQEKREGWCEQSLSIPIQEENDPRIFFNSPKYKRRQRPRAAKGSRSAPGEVRTITPREPFNMDAISWDGSVQVVVDRFDMFVDRMMHEHEKSPLSKLRMNEMECTMSRSPLPPIPRSQDLDESDTKPPRSLPPIDRKYEFSVNLLSHAPLPPIKQSSPCISHSPTAEKLVLQDVSDEEISIGFRTCGTTESNINMTSRALLDGQQKPKESVSSTDGRSVLNDEVDLPGCPTQNQATAPEKVNESIRKQSAAQGNDINPAEPIYTH